jgi:hypothetical protein
MLAKLRMSAVFFCFLVFLLSSPSHYSCVCVCVFICLFVCFHHHLQYHDGNLQQSDSRSLQHRERRSGVPRRRLFGRLSGCFHRYAMVCLCSVCTECVCSHPSLFLRSGLLFYSEGNVDHAGTVIQSPFSKWSCTRLLDALLFLLFTQTTSSV